MMSSYRRQASKAAKLLRRGWRQRTSGNVSDGDSAKIRTVHCNERVLNDVYGYARNSISTTKYNWITFLPGSLFVQYRKAAYWYFTAMAILSITPFSPYSQVSVILPLVFVLALGTGRAGWEDLCRSQGDKEVNSRPTQVLMDGEKVETLQWKDLRVGDLVRVTDGKYFPANLLLLSSSGPDDICYEETKNLDGETNLKAKLGLLVAGCYGLAQFCMHVFLWRAAPGERLPPFPLPTHSMVMRGHAPQNWERNVVAYDESETPKLEGALLLSDAISDQPKILNLDKKDEPSYNEGPGTPFQTLIHLPQHVHDRKLKSIGKIIVVLS